MRAHRNDVYRARRSRGKVWPVILWILAGLIVLAVILFYAGQKYIVYDSDGSLHVVFPIMETPAPVTEGGQPETVDTEVVLEGPDYSGIVSDAGKGLTELHGQYLTADKITPDGLTRAASAVKAAGGNALVLQMKAPGGTLSWKSGVSDAAAYGVNGTQMTLVRMASMAILTGIWLAAKNPAALKIDLRDLVWFVPAGALGLFMFGLFYTYSIQLVGMGTAAVLIYLMPSLVMLFSVVFLHEKFTPGKGLCLVLSLLGCALVSGVAGGVTLDAGGVAYGLGAALCYTLQNILLATKLKKYSPMTNLFYMFLFSAAASLVFTAAAGELPGVAYILTTPGALAANLGLGLVCSLAAQWLYTAALKTIPASRASIAATFEPVAAALFGLVLFGQKMDGFGVAGIVCEIAALVLLQLPAPAKRKG